MISFVSRFSCLCLDILHCVDVAVRLFNRICRFTTNGRCGHGRRCRQGWRAQTLLNPQLSPSAKLTLPPHSQPTPQPTFQNACTQCMPTGCAAAQIHLRCICCSVFFVFLGFIFFYVSLSSLLFLYACVLYMYCFSFCSFCVLFFPFPFPRSSMEPCTQGGFCLNMLCINIVHDHLSGQR